MKVCLKYPELYPELNESLEDLLSGMSRTNVMNICSFLLGLNSEESKFEKNENFIQEFFSQSSTAFAADLINRIKKEELRMNLELVIHNPYSSLTLFEYAYNNLPNESDLSWEESEKRLFRAYLKINELIYDSFTDDSEYQHYDEKDRLAIIHFMMSFKDADILNYDNSNIIKAQVIKSAFLYEFLQENAKFNPLLDEFLKHYEIPNWPSYIMKLFPITEAIRNKREEGYVNLKVNDKDETQDMKKFFQKLTINDIKVLDEHDFLTLRSNPIYWVNDDLYRITFELFVLEKIYTGAYWKLFELNNKLGSSGLKGNFRNQFCKEFSEKHLTYSVLNSIYGKRYKCFTGQQADNERIDGAPDYYVRNGNKIFLFESKDTLLKKELKNSMSFTEIEKELINKFYKTETGQSKAILQLINCVKLILDKKFSLDEAYKSENVKIFPILLFHQSQQEVAGLNRIIQSWFQIELNNIESEGYDISNVRPITMIYIDTLINYQDILISKRHRLEKLIDGYHKQTTNHGVFKGNSEHEVALEAEKSTHPFSKYWENELRKLRNKGKLNYLGPKMLMEKAHYLFTNR